MCAENDVTVALVDGVAKLAGASRALAAALARGGALGAAARLAQRFVDAHEAPERERAAAHARRCMDGVLRAAGEHSPAVVRARPAAPGPTSAGRRCPADAVRARRQAALQLGEPALSEPSSTASQRRLAAMAAAIARLEAEVAPGLAAEGPSQATLDDLRLATPALRPVGCWWSGCAPAPAGRIARSRAHRRPELTARRARAGAATCPARRRPACRRSCAPAATPRASARRRATRRPGARGTRARASACKRAPDRRGRAAPACRARPVRCCVQADVQRRAGGRLFRTCTDSRWYAPARRSAAARPARRRRTLCGTTVCARALPAGALRPRVGQRANRMSARCVSALAR